MSTEPELKRLKVRTFGSATIDIVATISSSEIERLSMSNAHASFLMIEEGRKVDAERIESFMGGGASNAAVSMARLGADVAIVARIGWDLEGEKIRDMLEAQDVDCRFLREVELEATGKSILISAHVKNSGIFTARGANTCLEPEEITSNIFDGVDLVYITGLSGASAKCLPNIVKTAHAAGAKVAMNPGIIQLRTRLDEIIELLPMIDLLAINADEADVLCAGIELDMFHFENSDAIAECHLLTRGVAGRPLASALGSVLSKGLKHILITNGAEGAYLMDEEQLTFCPIMKVQVGGTVGAGDSFTSTMAHSLTLGDPMDVALKKATINAASVVMMPDAQSGLLRHHELERRMGDADLKTAQARVVKS